MTRDMLLVLAGGAAVAVAWMLTAALVRIVREARRARSMQRRLDRQPRGLTREPVTRWSGPPRLP